MEPVSTMILFITSICSRVIYSSSFNTFRVTIKQGLHHGKSGEDGTRNEVRREDGCMPAGNNRCGEVEGYNCMNRNTSGVLKPASTSDKRFMPLPVFGRTCPSERSHTIKKFSPFQFCTVANCCQIRKQSAIPE